MSLMIRDIRKSEKWKVTNEIPRNRKVTMVRTHKNCQEKDVLNSRTLTFRDFYL